jgi:hypothetical protein
MQAALLGYALGQYNAYTLLNREAETKKSE